MLRIRQRSDRNVVAFGTTSFLNDTASEMAYWILPAFLATLGAGPAQIGLIEGIAESVASVAKLFSGYWTDRVQRRKPIVVAGYAVANAVKPVLAFATAWWHVLLVRFADRLSKGVRGAPRDVMVAESAGPARMGSAFGLLQAMDSAGAIAGPLLAIAILTRFDHRAVFLAAAVPGLLAVVIVSLFVREQRKERHQGKALSLSMAGLPSRFFLAMGAVTLFSVGNSSDMFLILRAQDVGIPARHAPLLGLVFNLTYTAFSWPAGRLSDRLPRHMVAIAGLLVFAVVYAAFAHAPSRLAIWTAMAFYGVYYALTSPVLRAMVADSVPENVRGRAFGIYYFVTSIATLLASVITGQLWQRVGAAGALYFSAAVALSAAAMFAVFVRPARR